MDKNDGMDRTALSAYMKKMGTTTLLSAREEKDLAEQIARKKIFYWQMILSHPPAAKAIAQRVRILLHSNGGSPLAEDDYESLQTASFQYRQRDIKFNREAFEASCRRFAESISVIDLDGNYSDDIISNIKKIGNRDRSSALDMKFPPKGSRRFLEYLGRVDRSKRDLRQLKERFIKANLRLVVAVAKKYYTLMPMEDVIQEGNFGLMKAVDRFDANLGYRFSTYATWWIRHDINRSIANKSRIVRIPVHTSTALHKMKKVAREYETQHGSPPSDEDLAKALGIGLKQLEKLQATHDGHVSLDSFESNFNKDLLDLIQGLYHPLSGKRTVSKSELEDQLQLQESVEILHEAIKSLRPIEQEIVRARFSIEDEEHLTLRELGDRHSLSRERIRQLEGIALVKLRKLIDELVTKLPSKPCA